LFIGLACATSACAPPGSTSPGRSHHDSWRATPYIIDSWSGVTAKRTMFGFKDPQPFEVAVLEEVEGPDAGGPADVHGKALRVKRSGHVEYLANANGRLISAEKIPPGLNVQVNGFQRAAPAYGIIFNPRAKKTEIAQVRPFERGTLLSVIKVKRVFVIEANGKKRLLWNTEVPFRDL